MRQLRVLGPLQFTACSTDTNHGIQFDFRFTMSFLARSFVRRAALAARPMVARRGFAEAVPADKLRLSLALPYETLYKNSDVYVVIFFCCLFILVFFFFFMMMV